jgi:transcriptional regulator with XRE-family HTH domain
VEPSGVAGADRRARARGLRAEAWTLAEIAAELRVARSTVSVWVRDVPFTPRPRRVGDRRPHPQHLARLAEVERLRAEGLTQIGALSERDLLIAGTALYAGGGAKTGGAVAFANTDPRMIELFLRFLRATFAVDEQRLRLRLYLHEGLDLDSAQVFWSEVTAIPLGQFLKPYRAVPDPSRRAARHVMGCASIRYSCSMTLRAILGLCDALLD